VPLDFTQAGSQTDFTAGTDSNWRRTNQTGLNLQWDVGEHLKIEADASYSKSWLNPDDRVNSRGADIGYGFGIGPSLGVVISGDSDEAMPSLELWRRRQRCPLGGHVGDRLARYR
jgi:iron complex outermembrane receptor protein